MESETGCAPANLRISDKLKWTQAAATAAAARPRYGRVLARPAARLPVSSGCYWTSDVTLTSVADAAAVAAAAPTNQWVT